MNTKFKWLGLITLALSVACSKGSSSSNPGDNKDPKVENPKNEIIGTVLPNWENGYLDIHAINTGRGESTLYMMPDGTTMLVDGAGSTISVDHETPPTPQKPNMNVSPGETIANYVKHFTRSSEGKLDYMLLTHYDNDHLGGYESSLPTHSSGKFKLSGFVEVGAKVDVDKIVDRSYPHFNFPSNLRTNPRISNYIFFLDWLKENKGTKVEQFRVGVTDQFPLRKNAGAYPNFEIRNIFANGVVWTGTGTGTRNTFPSTSELNAANASENIFSTVFTIKYGKFDYFAGADLQYTGRSTHTWKDVEATVAAVMYPVDVMKANHHATLHCNGSEILNKLQPQSFLIHVWRDVQPNPETISRLYSINKNVQVFSTNMTAPNRVRLASDIGKFKAQSGHIVVRVSPGGNEYMVYILDDNNQDYKVVAAHGPYKSE